MANPVWFIEEQYLRSKLAQLVESGETRFTSTAAVKQAIEEAGFTVFGHFTSFSLVEGTSPNQYFDAAEYLVAKANQLNSQPGETTVWTADTVRQAIKDAGFATVYDHFTQWGWKENVNPSSEFDVSSYFDSKLAQLQRTDPAGNWTVDKIKAVFDNVQLDPIEHYLLHGKSEGIDYTSNEAPQVADNVSVSGFEDASINGVLSATDADGDSLTFKLVDGPEHGALVLNSNGSYTYTPDANYNGTDSFSYKANDGMLDSVVATVTIDVKNVEDSLTTGLDNINLSYSVPTDDVITGSVSSQALASTYNPGDRIDGGAGDNTLRLSMDPGVVADSVEVSNMQTLDLRLTASVSAQGPVGLFMTDWDNSLEQINIKSNKSELFIRDQQTVADIAIVDKSTLSDAASYGFNYAAGVLDGDADTLNISVNNVNGTEGAAVKIDGGMEGVAFNVADRAGDQYASDINLDAQGATGVSVAGGLADQAFILDANVASGANFDSTAFAGDMELTSSDIATAAFGAGSDYVTLDGQANSKGSSYDLGEGNNTLTSTVNLAGSIVAGDGDDTVKVHSSVLATGSIDLGNGNDNDVDVDGDVLGQIIGGSGDDHVVVGEGVTYAASIDLGDGDNLMSVGADLDGDATVVFGTGKGELKIGGDLDDNASVTFAGGDNTVNVTGDVEDNASVTFADGNDALLITGNIGFDTVEETVSIDFADGNNRLIVENDITNWGSHSTAISFGDGDNTAWIKGESGIEQGEDGTTTITFGNGNNELLVGFERDKEGELVETNGGYADITGATIELGDGTNFVAVVDDVDNAHIHFGDGDGNQLNIGGNLTAAQPGTIIFGDGAGNSLNVDNNIINEHVVFGDGAGNSLQTDWLTGAVVEFGDGGNTLTSEGFDGTKITFGAGADAVEASWGIYSSTVEMGAGDDALTMSNDGWVGAAGGMLEVASVVDMGEGDDTVSIVVEGGYGNPNWANIYSGGFVQGGEGDDTLRFEAEDTAKLIARDADQVVSIDLLQEGADSYTAGQEVTVTFTRGDEEFLVYYTVIQSDIVQGNSASTSANVAAKLVAALNDDDTFPGYFDVSREAAELTITSDDYLVDFDITSSVGTVAVEQISDAHIGGIENLELVALNGDGPMSMTISADFNLIDGVENILLDSQEEMQSGPGEDSLENGDYTSNTAGGVTTFELIDLKGGEAITVSGFEASATGNRQVERITVGAVDGDHQIGDKIVVTLGETVITYVVTEADLNDATAGADANLIAIALADAITDAAEAAGFSVAIDANQITLVGSSDDNVNVGVDHLRTQTNTLVDDYPLDNPGSWYTRDGIDMLQAGDVVTLVVGAEEFSYTVTEQDCLRDQAEAVTEAFAALLTDAGIEGVTAAFGLLTFANDNDATVSVTRAVDQHIDKTGSTSWQYASASDDSNTDVIIDANLAADASDTTMDLTIAGEGSFDLLFSDEESGYTDLDLKLGDEFSHTVYTNGNQFGATITVSDVDGVNTAGQTVVLDAVLAHDVTSTSEANLVIDQYSVRADEVNAFDGETITVSTGNGDDHLTTAAQSALNEGSSIDLGAGENQLSLGWGNGVTINSAELEAIGDIDYSGDLTQFELLNNVELDAESGLTTLTMPGGVDDVATLRFVDLEVTGEDQQDLTIVGAANDFSIETHYDLDLYSSNGTIGTLTVQDAGGDEITGNLTVVTDDDEDGSVYFNLRNHALTAVAISADEAIELFIDGNEGAEFNIGPVTLVSEDYEAQLLVSNNVDSTVIVDSLTVASENDSDLEVDDNSGSTVSIGDVSLLADWNSDADVFLRSNSQSTIELGNVSIETHDFDQDDNDSSLEFWNNADTTLTVESLQIVSDYDVQLDIDSNEDSAVTVAGDVTLEANGDSETDADAFLDITSNTRTNVSLAVDGTVSLASCEADTDVNIRGNLNDHQPGDSSDLDAYTTYTVELGDVVLDAGFDANFAIDDNDDDTFFGDLVIKTGDVEMSAYNQAHLVIGEDSSEYGWGNESATVELGAVTLTAQADALVDVSSNDGRVYDLGASFPDASRYQQDLAVVTVGDLTADAGDDAMVNIDYNDLANIQFGKIDLQADNYVELCVDDNSRSNFTAAGVSLAAADGYSYFSFYSNASSWDSLADIPSGRDFITGPELYLIDGDLTVDGYDGSMVDLGRNDGRYGDEDRNLAITVTGDTTVSSENGVNDALLEIHDNVSVEVSLQGEVSVSSGEYADLDIYDNDNLGVTVDADVSVTSVYDYARIDVRNTDSSSVELNGQTDVYAYWDATLNIDNNDDSWVSLVDQTPAELLEGEDKPADVSLTSEYDDVYVNVTYNDYSGIELGKLSLDAYDDASINVYDNDDDSWITVGDVDVTAGSDIDFTVDSNDGNSYFSLVQIGAVTGEDYWANGISERGTITLSGDSVGSYNDNSGVYVEAGDDALVALGDFKITASDGWLDGGNDVDVHIHTSSFDSYIDVGDISINAENDVYFYAGDHGEDSRLSMGDITITAGSDAALDEAIDNAADVSSDIFFQADQFVGTEKIELDAQSLNNGVGNVYVDLNNAYDLSELTVSGTSAEIYLDGNIGAGDFTLDLSGLDGTFDEDARDYDVLGDGASDNGDQDDGSYVSTLDAYFDGDVTVQVGSGDLIYNAQHSYFNGTSEYDYINSDEDWNGDEGWFSLGSELDLTPVQQVQLLTFDLSDPEVGESAFFQLEVNGETQEVEIIVGAGVNGSSGTLGDTGISWRAFSNNGWDWADVEFTGLEDGSSFVLSSVTNAIGYDISGNFIKNYITQSAEAPVDGKGNAASETFEFVGDSIGEVVIGGFRPNGFVQTSQVDRLDLSGFADSAADLIITIDDNDGYFADVLIDFVDQDQGSIRLVGVGEYFTDANVNGIANSIIFA